MDGRTMGQDHIFCSTIGIYWNCIRREWNFSCPFSRITTQSSVSRGIEFSPCSHVCVYFSKHNFSMCFGFYLHTDSFLGLLLVSFWNTPSRVRIFRKLCFAVFSFVPFVLFCAAFICATNLLKQQQLNGRYNQNSASFKLSWWTFYVWINVHLLSHHIENERRLTGFFCVCFLSFIFQCNFTVNPHRRLSFMLHPCYCFWVFPVMCHFRCFQASGLNVLYTSMAFLYAVCKIVYYYVN